jgi:hypothetical protein
MANNWGIAEKSNEVALASLRSMPSNTATAAPPSSPSNDAPMNMRPIRLWSVVVTHSPTEANEAPDPVAALVGCVSMVVIGGGLFPSRARRCASEAVLNRIPTAGLRERDYP